MTDILYTMGTGIGALTVLAALGWLLGAAVPKGWRIDDSHSNASRSGDHDPSRDRRRRRPRLRRRPRPPGVGQMNDEFPTTAIFEVKLERPCPCCGSPHVEVLNGGIAASGTYLITAIDRTAVEYLTANLLTTQPTVEDEEK